jgi:integrase
MQNEIQAVSYMARHDPTAVAGLHSSGASLKVAQTQLRHADASTTSRYYIHVIGSEQRDAAEKVARILCPDVAKLERKSLHVN